MMPKYIKVLIIWIISIGNALSAVGTSIIGYIGQYLQGTLFLTGLLNVFILSFVIAALIKTKENTEKQI